MNVTSMNPSSLFSTLSASRSAVFEGETAKRKRQASDFGSDEEDKIFVEKFKEAPETASYVSEIFFLSDVIKRWLA